MKYGRTFNFSAGPAMMPEPVLEEIRDETPRCFCRLYVVLSAWSDECVYIVSFCSSLRFCPMAKTSAAKRIRMPMMIIR